ncbi:MAG TPA: hypothetical protein VMU04_12385 [Candidatus Acidoferrum sp.]|nr:hypothetical protein [Candidatus Acidoferrum sp.]
MNTVSAQYSGDKNFLGSTGNLSQQVLALPACSQTNACLSA